MRVETDFLGVIELPDDALYGVQTARAAANFAFSRQPLASERDFVRALASTKAAAAKANAGLGALDARRADAIRRAARELGDGALDAHLIVDMMEGSGGTSINMNINEVLANRALQLLGRSCGDYAALHPNDHVNRSQSTNDVIPAAIKIGCHSALGPAIAALDALAAAFEIKARAFANVLKLGRTCLQDAQPMTLGQSFRAYATAMRRAASQLTTQRERLLDLPLGATAIGTGFGAPNEYRQAVISALSEDTGVQWRGADDLFDALSNADGYAGLSADLRGAALGLAKIGNDLQLLSSGPAGGIGELRLPAVQAGSSIMPGKVNPVVPMAMCQIGFAVAGCDHVVAQACQQGQLEINPYEPVIALNLFEAIRLVTKGAERFRTHCIDGIEPDLARLADNLEASSAVATALLPVLGYSAVAEIVREAQASDESFIALADRKRVIARDEALNAMALSAGVSPAAP